MIKTWYLVHTSGYQIGRRITHGSRRHVRLNLQGDHVIQASQRALIRRLAPSVLAVHRKKGLVCTQHGSAHNRSNRTNTAPVVRLMYCSRPCLNYLSCVSIFKFPLYSYPINSTIVVIARSCGPAPPSSDHPGSQKNNKTLTTIDASR